MNDLEDKKIKNLIDEINQFEFGLIKLDLKEIIDNNINIANIIMNVHVSLLCSRMKGLLYLNNKENKRIEFVNEITNNIKKRLLSFCDIISEEQKNKPETDITDKLLNSFMNMFGNKKSKEKENANK